MSFYMPTAHGSSSLGIMHPFGTAHGCFFYFCLPKCSKAKFPDKLHCIGPLWPTIFDSIFVGGPYLVSTINVTVFDIIFLFSEKQKDAACSCFTLSEFFHLKSQPYFPAFFSAGWFNRIQQINIFHRQWGRIFSDGARINIVHTCISTMLIL